MTSTAAQSSVVKQHDDIIVCPICSELFTDPRSLPCIHAYCLKCIEGYSSNKQHGDKMPCPMSVCHKEFTIPKGGLSGLPKNFFIEQQLHVKQVSSLQGEPHACEVCDALGENDFATQIASMFCTECEEKLCDNCAKRHTVYKKLRNHKLVQIGELANKDVQDTLRALSPAAVCDKHNDKALDLFCNDCKMAICVKCSTASRKRHDISHIDDVIDKFQQQMTTDVDCLVDGVGKLQEMSTSVEQQKQDFVRQVAETENEIIKKADELTQLIERNKQTLLDELSTKRVEVVKLLDNLNDEITQTISLMENLKKYSEELSSKGAASDIARETRVIHDRVDELLKYDVIEGSRNDMDSIDVKFTSSTLMSGDKDNIIGNIDVRVSARAQDTFRPTLTKMLAGGEYTLSITSLDSQLFVVRLPTKQQIQVYSSETFEPLQPIPLPADVSDTTWCFLASCASNNCLYVSDHDDNAVYRVALGSITVSKWSVNVYAPFKLSVSETHHVLVLCRTKSPTIEEHTSGGSLVRIISLREDALLCTNRAIQLPGGQFVVCQGWNEGSLHRVCIVNEDGQVEVSYGSKPGSATGQLNSPFDIQVVENGSILVADCNNDRIVLLSKNVLESRVLPCLSIIGGRLKRPRALCLDESRGGRLYVAEEEGRILIFDNVDVSAAYF